MADWWKALGRLEVRRARLREALESATGLRVVVQDPENLGILAYDAFVLIADERYFDQPRNASTVIAIAPHEVAEARSIGSFWNMLDVKVGVALKRIRSCRHDNQKYLSEDVYG